MLAKIHSFVLVGIDAIACEVEADVSQRGLGKVTTFAINYPHSGHADFRFFSSTQLFAVQLSELNSTLRICLLFILQIVFIILLVSFVLIRKVANDQRTYRQVSKFMVQQNWEPAPSIPDRALKAISQPSFLIRAPGWNDYACIHVLNVNSVALYFGLTRDGGGRGYKRNTPVFVTDELRSPLECLVVHQTKGDPFRTQYALPIQGTNSSFVVCFQRDPRADQVLFADTMRIVELIFGRVVGCFASGGTAVIGPNGLVFTAGGALCMRDLDQSLGTLVRDSREFLVHCQEGYFENHLVQAPQ